MQKASHVPLWKPDQEERDKRWVLAGYGTTEVTEVIDGKTVTLKGRMVIRNSTDGPVPVLTFDAFIDGIKVTRRVLISTFSEPVA